MMVGSAFGSGGLMIQAAALLLLLTVALARSASHLRLGIAICALIVGLAFAVVIGDPVSAVWAGVIAVTSLAIVLLARTRELRVRFSDEERIMAEQGLPRLARIKARHFIDQGLWIEGRRGEVLTREGEPVSHLFFLGAGRARILSGGVEIATFAGPGFIGEMTVLSQSGATGTVVLDQDTRFWCVSGDALRRLLAEEPELRVLLENSFASAVSEKLRLSNLLLAEQRLVG